MENDFIKKLKIYSDKCRNMYELCLKLGIENVGGNTYNEIKKIANENEIILLFSGENKRINSIKSPKIEDLLINGSNISSNKLKIKLFEAHLKEEKCEKCGLTMWNNEKIPLELHHINGNHNDNRLENIQILCRNCHGQTDNFCGKNAKKKKNKYRILKKIKQEPNYIIDKKYLKQIVFTQTLKECSKELDVSCDRIRQWCKYYKIPYIKKEQQKYLSENKDDDIGICLNCGCIFKKNTPSQKYCCYNCLYNKKDKKPEKEILIKSLKEYQNFVRVGKIFGVSDNAIRKWCNKYGIPTKKTDLIVYINNLN